MGQLDAAYAVCRAIARREAKNFYYAFVALPRPKRNAICAIYAFMRQADDLADDEAMPIEERRTSPGCVDSGMEGGKCRWCDGRSGFRCGAGCDGSAIAFRCSFAG